MEDRRRRNEVDRFILDHIETIPHLEALLLLWGSKPRAWSIDELAARLYVIPDVAEEIIADLMSRALIERAAAAQSHYRYRSDDKDHLIEAVDATYRSEMIRVADMVHSKGSPAVRAFARAFRLRKKRE